MGNLHPLFAMNQDLLKQCTQCKEWKSRDLFNKRAAKADGLQSECRACHTERCRKYKKENPEKVAESLRKSREKHRDEINEKARAYAQQNRQKIRECCRKSRLNNLEQYRERERAYYHANKGKIREKTLKAKYGITLSQYNMILSMQEFKCACCGKEDSGGNGSFNVDHDHDTGRIRGLLCQNCNAGIGQLGDTVEGILNAVRYLGESPQKVEFVLDQFSMEDSEGLCD